MKFPTLTVSCEGASSIAVTEVQAKLLVEALMHTLHESMRSGAPRYPWYHRGDSGFGITVKSAQALAKKGLVEELVTEKWMAPTQTIRLTDEGFKVALRTAERFKKTLPRIPAAFFEAEP